MMLVVANGQIVHTVVKHGRSDLSLSHDALSERSSRASARFELGVETTAGEWEGVKAQTWIVDGPRLQRRPKRKRPSLVDRATQDPKHGRTLRGDTNNFFINHHVR